MFVTEDWYFLSHRKDLVMKMLARGFRYTIGTRLGNAAEDGFAGVAVRVEHIPFKRSLASPVLDCFALFKMLVLIRRERPAIVHFVALKPIILGIFSVLIFRKVKFVNALAGLGYIFTADSWRSGWLKSIVKLILRTSFKQSNSHAWVQNTDDKRLLEDYLAAVNCNDVEIIPGSGIDVHKFAPDSTL
ncbi:MAG: glycosyltransferase, partial [Pseudomonadota bacterium]